LARTALDKNEWMTAVVGTFVYIIRNIALDGSRSISWWTIYK